MAKKCKILAAIIIFGVIFTFNLTAQNGWTREDLQGIYMEHLRQEGYLPSIDEDGDIQFKVSGDNYFIIINESDLQFFQIYMGFSLTAFSIDDLLNAANSANRRSKVAKTTISSDGKIASITVELLLNSPNDFVPVFARSLSLIRNAEGIFRSQLRDIALNREVGFFEY
ncbi:MAG: YbjN domain-containing protein [Treponema sp.]|nr:YbjN domain-containing protein [Treponema sp.]